MRVDAFDYDLPEHLIAQTPLENRDESRLMVVDPVHQTITHTQFHEIPSFLSKGDVLVLNNSRVLPARLHAVKVDTGAKAELLLLKPTESERIWHALTRPAKRLRTGTVLQIGDGPSSVQVRVVEEREEGIRAIEFLSDEPVTQIADRFGEMPLPPYIHEGLRDKERYQTVYSETSGSVAAPTAGLHFTEALLDKVRGMGVEVLFVTLHVGLGTFRGVQVEDIEEHHMHSEWYEVRPETAEAINRAKQEGRRVIAVGTTALRTLESAFADGQVRSGARETDIFIYPGYAFQVIDALVTNFHLPKSTLVMLVSALMGLEMTKQAYQTAVDMSYRFFSFGDAMFITRRAKIADSGKV